MVSPAAIPRRRERLIVNRALVEIVRYWSRAYAHSEDRAGEVIEVFFVAACVFVGQAEGRPMSATKLAAYTGMPRTTVLRKLDVLMHMGLARKVQRAYCITDAALARLDYHYQSVKIIERAARELSETDSLPSVMGI